jgi:hypothetical protein
MCCSYFSFDSSLLFLLSSPHLFLLSSPQQPTPSTTAKFRDLRNRSSILDFAIETFRDPTPDRMIYRDRKPQRPTTEFWAFVEFGLFVFYSIERDRGLTESLGHPSTPYFSHIPASGWRLWRAKQPTVLSGACIILPISYPHIRDNQISCELFSVMDTSFFRHQEGSWMSSNSSLEWSLYLIA